MKITIEIPADPCPWIRDYALEFMRRPPELQLPPEIEMLAHIRGCPKCTWFSQSLGYAFIEALDPELYATLPPLQPPRPRPQLVPPE